MILLPLFPISPSSPSSFSTDVFEHLEGEMLTQLKAPAFKPDSSVLLIVTLICMER